MSKIGGIVGIVPKSSYYNLVDNNISVIPIKAGSKSPLVGWKQFQTALPTNKEIEAFSDLSSTMLAVVNGAVSGNLLTIDFDDVDTYKEFLIRLNKWGGIHVLNRVVTVKSPHGFHLRFRCEEAVGGNTKLACDKNGDVLIETRGEGGYCICPPSVGYKYMHDTSDMNLYTLTPAELEVLMSCARSFDGSPQRIDDLHHVKISEHLRSGDVYNERGSEHFLKLITDLGWERKYDIDEASYWCRPDKEDDGVSACYNHEGSGLFHVFSSNADVPPAAYTPFTFVAYSVFNRDFKLAARFVIDAGFVGTGEELVPFEEFDPIDLYEVPDFPVHIFPEWASKFINEVSVATQTPTDIASLLVLSVVASRIASKVEVQPKLDWVEPTCLYTATFADPASRKSPVFKICLTPVNQWVSMKNRATGKERSAEASRKRGLQLRLERAEKEFSSIKLDPDQQVILEQIMAECNEQLELIGTTDPYVAYCDDVTTEKLAELVSNNDGRMALFSDEAGVLEQMGGKYSNNSMDLYLKGNNGGRVVVHRIGREPNIIDNCYLTIGVTAQPVVLAVMGKSGVLERRGVFGRFLFGYPKSNVGSRMGPGLDINPSTVEVYNTNVYSISEIDYKQTVPYKVPHVFTFSEDAARLFWKAQEKIELELKEGGEMSHMTSWGGKLHGNLARIAAILHCMDYPAGDFPIQICGQVMKRAIALLPYLKAHAAKCYFYLSTNIDRQVAVAAINYLVETGLKSFTRRELHHKFQSKCPKREDLDGSISLLLDNGYIRRLGCPAKAGRPSEKYEVNPKAVEFYGKEIGTLQYD